MAFRSFLLNMLQLRYDQNRARFWRYYIIYDIFITYRVYYTPDPGTDFDVKKKKNFKYLDQFAQQIFERFFYKKKKKYAKSLNVCEQKLN